jgi:biotin carboxyl carrier protein
MDPSSRLARMNASSPIRVTRIAAAMYRVERDGRSEIVYAAGAPDDRWIFWNGQVFRGDFRSGDLSNRVAARQAGSAARESLTATMPARVVKILAAPGAAVRKGDTILVLEAMKMELPVRAPADVTVVALHCAEGELVPAGAVLADLK